MKRFMAMMLAMLLLCAAAPALAKGGEMSYDRVVDTMLNLREVIEGDFMTLKGVPESIQADARAWTEGVNEAPRLVVRLDIYECAYVRQYAAVFKSEHPMVSYEAQSTGVGEILNTAFSVAAMETLRPEETYTRIGSVLNALNHSIIYADPSAEEGGVLYVVLYDNAEPIFLLTNVENGAVSLTTYIVPSGALADCRSYADVAMWFLRWGCPISGAEIRPE